MRHGRIGLFALILIFLLTPKQAPGKDEPEMQTVQSALEAVRREVHQLREALHETNERLQRLHRLNGIARYRVPRTITLLGEPIPLHRRALWERMDREFLLAVGDLPQVLLWVKRANRYFPMIEEQIRVGGLPDDLKYVAIVESALRPEIRSRAGAVGLWQFMPSTGAKYHLRRTRWVDERRDPHKSTRAALAYLSDLSREFGDWLLAVAAYNVGERAVGRELERQEVRSYFDLVLPSETERYIFRIAAAKVILTAPEKFGFDLDPGELYEPLRVERLEARVERGRLDLVDLAQTCGLTFRSFLRFNPHFREKVLPRGLYDIYVPLGQRNRAASFLGRWERDGSKSSSVPSSLSQVLHRVKSGETLWEIARKYDVYVEAIQEWNDLGESTRIIPGQRLTIYR